MKADIDANNKQKDKGGSARKLERNITFTTIRTIGSETDVNQTHKYMLMYDLPALGQTVTKKITTLISFHINDPSIRLISHIWSTGMPCSLPLNPLTYVGSKRPKLATQQ